jgi:hypothetical protein
MCIRMCCKDDMLYTQNFSYYSSFNASSLVTNKVSSGLKIGLLVYKALNRMAPQYITDLLSFKPEGNHHLRSDDQSSLLQIPKTNSKILGDRSFKHAAPLIWNSLPLNIRRCETVNCFKTNLKTFLFRKAYK